jgi:protein-S-isoprenylcysteine O-methyltransferase Ste14
MSRKSLVLVIIQFSCFVLLIFGGSLWAKGYWFYIQIIALLFTIWATLSLRLGNFNIQPEVKKTAVFVTSGPYSISRNPIYSGLLLVFGFGVFYNLNYYQIAIYLVLAVVLLLKIQDEEKYLTVHFGEAYTNYKANSYRLIPYIY